MHGLRGEYQDRVNFVILDFDIKAERELATELGVGRHPAFALVAPDSAEALSTSFGPQREQALRELLDGAIASHGG